MIDKDPGLELEPDQQTLKDAWKTLAEALVLRGETINPMLGEAPATPNGQQPFMFSQPLDKAFAHRELLDDKSLAVTSAGAEYYMPHKADEDDDQIFDVVGVRWTGRMQGTDIFINNSVIIQRITADGIDTFEGYAEEEYVERPPDGKEHRISKAGYKYSADNPSSIDEHNILQDAADDERPITFDDTEKVHKVASIIRPM